MGTTTKIIFGSVLALSVALMFLIFSMQKSAQLTLDLEDVRQTVQKKEQEITKIQQNLADTTAVAESAKSRNAVIPKLQKIIDKAEKEKLGYEQQIDDLQGQLKKADAHLAEYSLLQEEFKNHQVLLADAKKATILAEEKTAQTNEELKALQLESDQREEQLNQLIAELEQRDRVIQVYKEKLDTSVDEITLLQQEDSVERLNLNLILDELAVKTHLVEELANRIIKLGGSADVSSSFSGPNSNGPVAQADDQAVIEQLTLENDSLKEKIGDQAILIHDLKSEIKSQNDLLTANQTEIEELIISAQGMNEELSALRLLEQNNQQELFQLKNNFVSKEKELVTALEKSDKLSASLTEKIATLENQLAYFTDNKDDTLFELNKMKEEFGDLIDENEKLVAALADTQISLEEAQKEKAQLENNFQTSQTALKQEQADNQALLSSEIEPFKLALAKSEKRFNALNELYQKLEKQLADVNKEKSKQEDLSIQLAAVQTVLKGTQEKNVQFIKANDSLKQEIDRLQTTVDEQKTLIEQLGTQLTENKAQLTELETKDEQQNVPKVSEADIAEQEERIARLIEEVAAAKTLAEEQTAALKAREKEVAALKEKAAASAALEEEKKKD
ncbi:MAG: hypothetical protein K9K37_05285 [Desulfocapsa sp.]|nr:hypothetical protein [Desulfocapsa sp.]